MPDELTLNINGQNRSFIADPETPLLYVLRGELGLKAPKYGCGEEQCGACKVLVDGAAVPSCQLPLSHVEGAEITTVEGLGIVWFGDGTAIAGSLERYRNRD